MRTKVWTTGAFTPPAWAMTSSNRSPLMLRGTLAAPVTSPATVAVAELCWAIETIACGWMEIPVRLFSIVAATAAVVNPAALMRPP